MRREWILNDAEKALIKEKKMTKYVIRRQKELERQSRRASESSTSSSSEPVEEDAGDEDMLDGILSQKDADMEISEPLDAVRPSSWDSLDNFDQLFSLDLNSTDLLSSLESPDNLFDDLLKITDDDNFDCSQFSFTDEPLPSHSPSNGHSTDHQNNSIAPTVSAATTTSFEQLIESLPSRSPSPPLLPELGLPSRELLYGEKHLIEELTQACLLLQNPYQRIIDAHNENYYYGTNRTSAIFRTQYHFFRMVRMAKRLTSFRSLPSFDQVAMLKATLVEMLNIQSILMFNADRKSWRFIDDKMKSSVMVRQDLIKPFCVNFEAHQNMPKKFLNEWKNDGTIFDLLTAIILFNPRPEYHEYDKIKEEHLRYTSLLRRYLEMKYPTLTEATDCFNQLMSNIHESRQLVLDIVHFFRSFRHILQSSPLFVQVFDLKNDGQDMSTSLMAIESSNLEIANESTNAFELDLDSLQML